MKRAIKLAGGVLSVVGLCGAPAAVRAHWNIGIGIGFPVYAPPVVYYYPTYPVYYPAPVVVQQPAVVYQAPPPAAPATAYAPPPATVTAQASPADVQADVQHYLQLLSDPNDQVRSESVLQLGRLRAQGAVDAIAATLAGDRSPAVREASARALALIGSRRALPALQRAAQYDPDEQVRHSATFAIDVVQTGR